MKGTRSRNAYPSEADEFNCLVLEQKICVQTMTDTKWWKYLTWPYSSGEQKIIEKIV